MVTNGLFVTLGDERSLALYLSEGVFSQHMPPQFDDDVHHSSNHYKIMADYACARPGTHVFFFRERTICYGGEVIGRDDNHGAFYLNGPTSPMGRRANAPLVWDESTRDDYERQDRAGVFQVPSQSDPDDTVQSFLLRFDTSVPLAGRTVRSDDLYFELGRLPFPLQSNTIQNLGFCPLGPGETTELLSQLQESEQNYDTETADVSIPDVHLEDEPVAYCPEFGIDTVEREQLTSEAHLEASVIANPSLLPDCFAPGERAIVRQAPISPLKPMQVDEVDICYYDPTFEDGLYPNEVLELKYTTAEADTPGDPGDAEQIQRYRRAIDKMAEYYLEDAEPDDISVGMFAPSYERAFPETLDQDTINRVAFRLFDGTRPQFVNSLDRY